MGSVCSVVINVGGTIALKVINVSCFYTLCLIILDFFANTTNDRQFDGPIIYTHSKYLSK